MNVQPLSIQTLTSSNFRWTRGLGVVSIYEDFDTVRFVSRERLFRCSELLAATDLRRFSPKWQCARWQKAQLEHISIIKLNIFQNQV